MRVRLVIWTPLFFLFYQKGKFPPVTLFRKNSPVRQWRNSYRLRNQTLTVIRIRCQIQQMQRRIRRANSSSAKFATEITTKGSDTSTSQATPSHSLSFSPESNLKSRKFGSSWRTLPSSATNTLFVIAFGAFFATAISTSSEATLLGTIFSLYAKLKKKKKRKPSE